MLPATLSAGSGLPSGALRILIVDGDALTRGRIRDLLAPMESGDIVRESADGPSAVAALRAAPADLVFLEAQLLGMSSFEVIAEVGTARMPPFIITSAHAEFAVRAFDAYALDYLVKPFTDERFAMALARGRERVAALDARLLGLVGLLGHLRLPPSARYPDSFAVKSGDQYVVVHTGDIDWIEAHGNYAKLHVQKRSRLLAKSLATLEKEVLDPERFVRVHRSAIVNMAKVVAVRPQSNGEVTLVLWDGTMVDCSRGHRNQLKDWLYFTT